MELYIRWSALPAPSVVLPRAFFKARKAAVITLGSTTSAPQMSAIYAKLTLQNVRDIRLLSLHPAANLSDALQGELNVVDLASSGDFEALSYTWGPPFEGQKLANDMIEISGSLLETTGNLGHALRRLRLTTQSLILWVDAICIDQDNPRERGHQVRFMADIFKAAIRVLAWLGEDSEYRDGEFFLRCSCHVDMFWPELDQEIDTNDRLADRSPDIYDTLYESARSLKRIFQDRRYFARRWVLQEQVVARDILLICGEWRLGYYDFVGELSSYHDLDDTPRLMTTYLLGVEHCRHTGVVDIIESLHSWQHARCRDERDIVLALASLWSDLSLHVDYSMSTEEVYIALAEAIVESIASSKLEPNVVTDPEAELRKLLLVAVCQSVDRSYDGTSSALPSWVPDWRQSIRVPSYNVLEKLVNLRAEVISGKRLYLTVAYYGELHFSKPETEAQDVEYYLVSGNERIETTELGPSPYLDWLCSHNNSVAGSLICSVANVPTRPDLQGSLILQPAGCSGKDFKIIGNLQLNKDEDLPKAVIHGYHERRVTIV